MAKSISEMETPIVFNRAYVTGAEFDYMREAIANAHLASGGAFSARCASWLAHRTGSGAALLTHSCTAALEMAFTLADVGPEDEVIMPSFTFVTTANAVVGRGGRPVFVDIRPDTLCMDEQVIEQAITRSTKAIVPVHYAGVSCDMDLVVELARASGVLVIEDAAQAVGSAYAGSPLGSLGALGALSFHETKNVSCGEGGALLINDERFLDRAEVVLEKGTDRRNFARGRVDKYTWIDVGSSFGLSELAAAYLWAQLQHERLITSMRLDLWAQYHRGLAQLETGGFIRRPVVPTNCEHNAHMYYVLVRNELTREALITHLEQRGIHAVFHYVPLHSSPAGLRYARAVGTLDVTTDASGRILRLPLWPDLGREGVDRVVTAMTDFFEANQATRKERGPRARLDAGRSQRTDESSAAPAPPTRAVRPTADSGGESKTARPASAAGR